MNRNPALLLLLFFLGPAGDLASGQQQGPLPPPPPKASSTPRAPGGLRKEKPALPVEEIIRQFAAKEAELKLARQEYSYKQFVSVREYDADGRPGGRFERSSEVIFLPDSTKRYERITREPPSTLRLIGLTREDMADLENIQPFLLTTDDLSRYHIAYLGREQVDDIPTYVFRVRPIRIEKGQRYFEGRIWVDEQDLQIVKTRGKAVPDIRDSSRENLFATFETYRENVNGQYWFPTYTRADDVLHFRNSDVRIRITIRYSDYKRRDVSSRILASEPVSSPTQKPPH
jgi:hypothetical protein